MAVACMALPLDVGFARAQPLPDTPTTQPAQIQSRLVEVRVNGAPLPEFQEIVLADDGRLWVQINNIVEFAEGRVEPAGAATVYELGSAVQGLRIEPASRKARVGATEQELGDLLMVAADSLMLERSALQSLFGLTVNLRAVEGYMDVLSERPLPRDLRILREGRWGRMGQGQQQDGTQARVVDVPYVAGQALQADVNLGANQSETGQSTAGYDVSVAAEALYLTHRLFVAGNNEQKIANARWWAGRADPRGGILGLDSLYGLSVGDVPGMSSPMVGSLGSGRGVRIQAAPVALTDSFSRTAVQGDATPGWDAELYVDDMLRDYQRVGPTGRFLFSDIGIKYGSNRLRVVLYGPGGLTRTQVFYQSVSAGMVPPGQAYGWASWVQPDHSVFGLHDNSNTANPGNAVSLRGDWGVSDYLTLSAQWAQRSGVQPPDGTDAAPVPTMAQDYRGLEVRTQLRSLGATVGLVDSASGRHAWYGNTYLPLGRTGLGLGLESAEEGFESPYVGSGTSAMKRHTRITTSVPLGSASSKWGSIALSGERVERQDASATDVGQAIYGHSMDDVPVTHILELTRSLGGGGTADWSQPKGYYRLLSSYIGEQYLLRGELVSELQPEWRFSQANVQATFQRTDRDFFTAGANLSADGQIGVAGAYSKDFGQFTWTMAASSSGTGYSLGTTLTFSIGFAAGRGWRMASAKQADAGALELQTFRDHDLNGVQDAAEPGIQGLQFELNGVPVEERSDALGRIVFHHLDPSGPVRVSVTRRYMEDDFLTTPMHDMLIWPRVGRLMQVSIPLVDAVNVEGSVGYTDAKGLVKGLGLATVSAFDAQGNLVAEAKALSDGYFNFDGLYAGRWLLKATTRRLRAKGAEVTLTQELDIGNKVDRVGDVKLVFPYVAEVSGDEAEAAAPAAAKK